MNRLALGAVIVITGLLVLGCSNGEEAASETEVDVESLSEGEVIEEDETSEAARARGIAVEGTEEEGEPQILLDNLVYEWRVEPEPGLHVKLKFVNPVGGYERARGRLFMIASSRVYDVTGVYPWGVEVERGTPTNHREGTRLLFRDEQTVRAVIPYKATAGYYDVLKIIVFDEEGGMFVNTTYDLELTGEPSGPKEPKPDMVL
jgi:hypothetical protein